MWKASEKTINPEQKRALTKEFKGMLNNFSVTTKTLKADGQTPKQTDSHGQRHFKLAFWLKNDCENHAEK